MEELEPLTITEIGLAARHVVKLSSVDEQDLDSPRLEQFVEGDPVYGRALHGHRLDTLLDQPVGELVQLARRRRKDPDVGGCRRHAPGHRPSAASCRCRCRQPSAEWPGAMSAREPRPSCGPSSWGQSCTHLMWRWPRPEVAGVLDSDLGECSRGPTRA